MTTTQPAASGVVARHSSETAEHYTPAQFVSAARKAMGGWIDLDPASCELANRTVEATAIYTAPIVIDGKEEWPGGFVQEWRGRVFLNPPGGRCDERGRRVEKGGQSSAKAWWFKLAREFRDGRVTQAVFLGFSLELLQVTQTKPPDGLPPCAAFPLCVPARRIAYMTPKNRELFRGASPPHASFFAYLGPSAEAFRDAFRHFGVVR